MFQVDKFLFCIKLETGCLIIAWWNYIWNFLLFWISIIGISFEVITLVLGEGKLRLFIFFLIYIAIGGVLKFVYKKFINEIGNLDKSVVIWPIVHHIFASITIFPTTIITLFILGASSDTTFVLVITIFEFINIYCLIILWSLYKTFQNGMPLTNEV